MGGEDTNVSIGGNALSSKQCGPWVFWFFNGFVSSKFPINTGAEWSGTCKSNSCLNACFALSSLPPFYL